MNSSANRARSIVKATTPSANQLIECRGGLWKFIREHKGFWELELIRHGAHFTENPIRVFALPNLEHQGFKILSGTDALCPAPDGKQNQLGKLLLPTLRAKQNQLIDQNQTSSFPSTAAGCAIEFKDWQFEPWRRIVAELPFPRLLIADDVGLGKTTEAAIILAELARRRRAERALIIAPQHLCEKWQDELFNRFGLAFELFDRRTRERLEDRGVTNPWEVVERVIVSRDFAKRWENFKPLSHVEWDIVVIDECHHFVKDESGNTTRLREFAEKIAYRSPGLLLLSATPFTGSESEFNSILTLIDPKFASEQFKKWNPNSPYLIRRLKRDVKKFGENIQDRSVSDIRVVESDLSSDEKKAFALVAMALAERMVSPDFENWDRLLEEVARKRLSSSWRAFHETISSENSVAGWFNQKTKDLVQKLSDTFDSAKLRRLILELRQIFKVEPTAKVVIFTEAVASQEQIRDYLATVGKFSAEEVATIEGSSDRTKRHEIEANFANPNSPLRVLIATDTISEGKDLQHACHHLIHFELPWSLVKIEQRNGRIDRLGQSKTPFVYNLVLDLKETPDQRVVLRLSQKILKAQAALGSVSPILETSDDQIYEAIHSEDELAKIESQIDQTEEHLRKLGFDTATSTPMSPGPSAKADDHQERRVMFDLMVSQLGGQLHPNGEVESESLLSLPHGWTLPDLIADGFGYPDEANPWRVTFSARHYLSYEKYLLRGGEAKKPLQFLSPIHPIVLQVESRFRRKMAKASYPIFGIQGAAYDYVIVAELTARSKSGRIVAQTLRAFDLKSRTSIDPAILKDIKAAGCQQDLPPLKVWQGLDSFLNGECLKFSSELEDQFKERRTQFLLEQNNLGSEMPGMTQRRSWIEEIWSVDKNQGQFQVTALLVNR